MTKKRSRTNWAKIDAFKNGEIDVSDIPEQGKAFFKRAVLRLPEPKTAVTIRLDQRSLSGSKQTGLAIRHGSTPYSWHTWKRTKDEARVWRACFVLVERAASEGVAQGREELSLLPERAP